MTQEIDFEEPVLQKLSARNTLLRSYLHKAVNLVDRTKFAGLSDAAERAQLVEETLQEKGVEPLAFDAAGGAEMPEKSFDKARECKEKGNELFKAMQYGEARDMYTKALQHFPYGGEGPDQEYAILFANRSAALEHGRIFKACISSPRKKALRRPSKASVASASTTGKPPMRRP